MHTTQSAHRIGETVSYPSHDSMIKHFIDSMMQTGSILQARLLAKEINELNGYEVVTAYHISKVSAHLRENAFKSDKRKTEKRNEKREIAFQNPKVEITESIIHKTKSLDPKGNDKSKSINQNATCQKGNPYRELQKAYMRMYTDNIESNT